MAYDKKFERAKAFLAKHMGQKSAWGDFVMGIPAEGAREYVLRKAKELRAELAAIADISEDEDPEMVAVHYGVNLGGSVFERCTWKRLKSFAKDMEKTSFSESETDEDDE